VDIGVDPSWLFALLLVVTSLASGFARWQVAWGPGFSLVVAFAGAALFFTSVLLHELAHAVVARAFGIPVHGITLFLFGGVSSLEREPTRPRDEFVTALVGPLASFALSALFLVAAIAIGGYGPVSNALVDRAQPLAPMAALFAWLAPVNFGLGVFNLLPGFPLDGGRILRSILWRTTGDLRRSTRIATSVGQALGWTFIALGFAMAFGARVPLLGSGLVGGLWVAAIGWFLRNAAFATMRDVEIRARLAGVDVQQLMRHPPPSVPANVSVAMLRDHWLYTSGAEVFPVVWDEHFAGWIDRATVQSLSPEKQAVTMVAHVMVRAADVPYVAPTDPVTDALQAFGRARKPVLPVVREGHLIGWLMLEDVLRVVERGRDVPALEPLWERGVRMGQPLET
jgi:Zn-dependent protease